MSNFLHGYMAWNFAMPTTAAPTPLSTGTAIKTMLQIAPTRLIEILEWGYTFDDIPGADSAIELLSTGTIAATVTAHSSTGIIKLGHPTSDNSQVTLGITATGFNGTAEGAITATRLFDAVTVSSTEASAVARMNYSKTFMPGEFQVAASDILRVRVTTPTSGVGMLTYVKWLE